MWLHVLRSPYNFSKPIFVLCLVFCVSCSPHRFLLQCLGHIFLPLPFNQPALCASGRPGSVLPPPRPPFHSRTPRFLPYFGVCEASAPSGWLSPSDPDCLACPSADGFLFQDFGLAGPRTGRVSAGAACKVYRIPRGSSTSELTPDQS
ncbi:hypothetical protein EXIGLDRAFT_724811 [Exidia glandulosa HHB12029]|uniref:Uncharacterized protein n=1 Tax=Exidia glandulosa HHB12029 TaxID=1314781 RepID=A0A165EAA0_EXIGL|nr:hypothetical protein EXIGLDRAFT_724811 [Exidia glandulosa HHB12029]